MQDLTPLLQTIPRLTVSELAQLAPQLAACLKACEVQLTLAAQAPGVPGADTYLTPAEVAQLLGVKVAYVYRNSQDLPGRIVLGPRKYVFSRRQLEEGLGLAASLRL